MARVFFWIGGAVFVAALLVCACWYVFVLGRTAGAFDLTALTADAGLFTLFALHHTLFARDPIKRLFGSLPPQVVRSIYVYIASALLIAMCAFWRPIGGDLYQMRGAAAAPFVIAQLAGIWITARAVRLIDPLELAGIRPERRTQQLQSTGVYRWVRHPIYLGWVLAVFATPHLTGDRLAFAAVSTLYLAAAVPFEEDSLRRTFGEEYGRYVRSVRWRIVPFIY
jgi:methanethiol S-methyltransferase